MGHSLLLGSLLSFASCILAANWIGEVKEENGVTYQCKCYKDNACWPTTADWSALNATVQGALQVAIPPGAVCHNTFTNEVGNVSTSTYNAAACANVQANWINEQWL